jgi:hypothetical protein
MEIASSKRIKYNGTDKKPHTAGGTNVPKSVEVEQPVKPKWDPSQYCLDFDAMAGCQNPSFFAFKTTDRLVNETVHQSSSFGGCYGLERICGRRP